MSSIRIILTVVIIMMTIISCNEERNKTETIQSKSQPTADITGNYVSDSYDKRSEGYDWVAVTISKINENEIFLSVRSRADNKKPTCTFDSKAYKIDDSTYYTSAEGKRVIIRFTSKAVEIAAEKPEDETALYFFCSGGATVAGTYKKIGEPLDSAQIDKTSFSKILRLQDMGFNVTSMPKGAKQEIEIYPFGLESVKQLADGRVFDAEIEDLDADGFPEVVVYTQSGENNFGDVIVCSAVSKNAAIQCYFPPVSKNSKINSGYNGFDSFTLAERYLVQRFPIYNAGTKTGKIRQISYTLEKGENTKVFKVKDVIEFNER